jgi:hypothetical protein
MELFGQAETFGRPVRELLTGVPGPLTSMERYLWGRFNLARARLRQQAGKAGR